MSSSIEFGVSQVAERIHSRLKRYIEAQYHVRDAGLIEERQRLLEEPGGIAQLPFVEVTPSYAVADSFSELKVPDLVRSLLQELASLKPGIGVFPPYRHQADALEHFFSHESDLIVATGTGSGKTETFLYAILGLLASEGETRRANFALPGVRALLLYPMNALVSDQTSRLRRLLADERVAGMFRRRWGRHPRFGMYTSRTPYPGTRSGAKDQRHLEKLISYYESLERSTNPEQEALVKELRKRGRWPAKDITRFFARDMEEQVIVQTGKKAGTARTMHHWDRRFMTQPGDSELFTRHEIQAATPDLLITNYSMLEYMLLRPIERPIFASTRKWLQADKRNQLLLVLDEAHMYRGVGGAEVGLLIRRLTSRLGIERRQLRCILTSASLSSGPNAETVGSQFAEALTGKCESRSFAVIRGTREARTGSRPGSSHEADSLQRVNASILAAAGLAPQAAQEVLDSVAKSLGWSAPPQLVAGELLARQHVCKWLTGFGPLEFLLALASGNALPFTQLARALFPDAEPGTAERATDGLLALGTFCRRLEPGREEQPLLPTRVHLLFRGLPTLFVCINSSCTSRRGSKAGATLVGRLFTEPRTQCDCGARTYELLTHRDCGTAYLRVFGDGPSADFYWHERGGVITDFGQPLHELHLLLDEPHPRALAEVTPVVVDVVTGRVLTNLTSVGPSTRLCYRPTTPVNPKPNLSTFGQCPSCLRNTMSGGALKIMDLATKGEQPFANLIREQFVTQVATAAASEAHPNEGRKALLFSDGRQKAARLARDLPREVERDSFREAIALSAQRLVALQAQKGAVLDESLYAAFVSVCAQFHLHFFDLKDQEALLEECGRFNRDYGGDLGLALDSEWRPAPTTRYRQALIRQIGDPYYSLVAACAAVIEVRPMKFNLVRQRIGGLVSDPHLADIVNAWLQEMLRKSAFDPLLPFDSRLDEFAYFQPVAAADGLQKFFRKIGERAGLDALQLAALREALFDVLTRGADNSGRLVVPDALRIRLAHEATWLQCVACGHMQMHKLFDGCINCGDNRLEERPPTHPYMISRKGFFREPIVAVLRGERPIHITVEEHTAQLSQRDAGEVYATTEEFELRFQDVPLGKEKPPVDILSCTTTMEVGIDIGSLTAVGLRTVPPQRENYQQRAGRAGRRGTSVSSVLTFSQGGAHDSHYFRHPEAMISGAPREPRIKSDNRRLARRHIHSHLLQTFFNTAIDALSPIEQRQLAENRPGIFSAFGDANEFFKGTGAFSHQRLDAWLQGEVLASVNPVLEEIANWLPPEIAQSQDSLHERRVFARSVTEGLRRSLQSLGAEFSSATAAPIAGAHDDEEENLTLLDLLFDRGLLPSYAFPTELCSFTIQEQGDYSRVKVVERPQLGKSQALSEYAPGRLLVVNKKTYRVGGIFGGGVPTAKPAETMFAGPLGRYVGCSCCGFVRMEPGIIENPTLDGDPCPVCRTALFVRDFLDPPGFSPEAGRALGEGDREQEVTYASSAQLPELLHQPEFEWRKGPGPHLNYAYGQDVLLVVANKGLESSGFSVCDSCGASWLDGEEPNGAHQRPFVLPPAVRARENAPPKCSGSIRRGLFLGHEFRTDILLLRGAFREPIGFDPQQPWLFDGLATLAEALSLAASRRMDIDPGELSAGFRLLPSREEDLGSAEVYLFDTASGGAGYAADAGEDIEGVLGSAEHLLRDCPGSCERSCTQCLRHYGNRFLHTRLDRRLALSLLSYFRDGVLPASHDCDSQRKILAPLARWLSMEGWSIGPAGGHNQPLVAEGTDHQQVTIRTYPCLLSERAAMQLEQVGPVVGTLVLIPDYVVERDLPAAYQTIHRVIAAATQTPHPASVSASSQSSMLFAVRDLRRLGTAAAGAPRTARLLVAPGTVGDLASRVPTHALRSAGFSAGRWLVLRHATGEPHPPDTWHVVLRPAGVFQATGESWTIAHVKRLDGSGPAKLQLSYGSATERRFRVERIAASEVALAAIVVCEAADA